MKFISHPLLWKIMKLTVLQLIVIAVFSSITFANNTKAQALLEKKISLKVENQSIKSILNKIEKLTDARFSYQSNVLLNNQKVTLTADNESVSSVLKRILFPIKVSFEAYNDKTIILSKETSGDLSLEGNSKNTIPNAINISGKVTDETGAPLPGVNILEKGTANGAVTDVNGSFNISVTNEASILLFSFIGYATVEQPVGNNSTLNIQLKTDIKNLNEVVVIGYGEKSRRLMTENVGKVESKELNQLPVASADQAIQGRISGVQVSSVDGTPGSPVQIRIRGVSTTGGNQPLFVIDGVPVGNNDQNSSLTGNPSNASLTNPLSTINPADIESVSVLKDASSAAIYGVRAGNGVVLITTKRGKSGKPKVSFDVYKGVQNVPKRLNLLNTEQLRALTVDAIANRNAYDNSNQLLPVALDPNQKDNVLGINTDWQNAVIVKNAPIENYNMSVSGGNDKANYFVSGGYFKQSATQTKWDLERYTLRVNSDLKIGNRLKIGETMNISFQKVARGSNGNGDGNGFFYRNVITMPTYFKIYDDENKVVGNRYGFYGNDKVAGASSIGNPIALNQFVSFQDNNVILIGGIYAELEIINGLKFRSSVNGNLGLSRSTSFRLPYTLGEAGLDRNFNDAYSQFSQGISEVFTNTLNFNRSFGDHKINAVAGVEYQNFTSNGLEARNSNFISNSADYTSYIANGSGPLSANGAANKYAFYGYIGRLSYNYKDKYLLTGTVRRDGSSFFNKDYRYAAFPSVSAGWIVSEESFLKDISFISSLKLRGSWGQLGGNPIEAGGSSQFTATAYNGYPLGTGQNVGKAVGIAVFDPRSGLNNKSVTWEKIQSWDAGFDAFFLNNKINLMFAYYNRETKNLLSSAPISDVSGYYENLQGSNSSVPINLGLVKNTGLEFELGYTNTFTSGLKINVSGNFTTVKNRLVSLTPGVTEFTSNNSNRTAIGQPIGYFYGYKTSGIYQTTADANNSPILSATGKHSQPGDVKYVDVNGTKLGDGQPNNIIDPNDKTYIGKPIPDYYYGLSVSANYKNFDVNILFQGVGGVQIYNKLRQDLEAFNAINVNQSTAALDRWTPTNPSNSTPRAILGDPTGNNNFSDRFVENGSFFRFKNIQLGYNIPASILSKTKIFQSVRIYIAGTNLFRVTKYKGLDPEVSTYGNNSSQLTPGIDNGVTPQPKTTQIGLQVQF